MSCLCCRQVYAAAEGDVAVACCAVADSSGSPAGCAPAACASSCLHLKSGIILKLGIMPSILMYQALRNSDGPQASTVQAGTVHHAGRWHPVAAVIPASSRMPWNNHMGLNPNETQ